MSDKQKILCLHGYHQNGVRFKNQTGAFRKILKNEAEFFYLSAPHKIPYSYAHEGEEAEERSWWFSQPSRFTSRDVSNYDIGLKESVAEIEKINKEQGPFQGIMGFSQGAALTGLLSAMKQRNEIQMDFTFVIIFSGFKSNCTLHEKYYKEKININSLHVIGETDQIITPDISRALANVFVNPTILLHPGGHFVPARSFLKQGYIDFVAAQKNSL